MIHEGRILDDDAAEADQAASGLRKAGLATAVFPVDRATLEQWDFTACAIIILAVDTNDAAKQQICRDFASRHLAHCPKTTLIIAGAPSIKRRWMATLRDLRSQLAVEINKPYDTEEVCTMARRILNTLGSRK